jgi:hypothetical protein
LGSLPGSPLLAGNVGKQTRRPFRATGWAVFELAATFTSIRGLHLDCRVPRHLWSRLTDDVLEMPFLGHTPAGVFAGVVASAMADYVWAVFAE